MSRYPRDLLRGLPWSFGRRYASSRALVAALHRTEVERERNAADRWHAEEVVLQSSRIRIIYSYWEGNNEVDRELILLAPEEHGFTAEQLLFLLNEDAARLAGQDRRFLEGLTLVDEDDPPTYVVRLGS
jgi:hypothetical protein